MFAFTWETVRSASGGSTVVTENPQDKGPGSKPSRQKSASAGAGLPGGRRLTRMAGQAGSTAGSAYQGAMESVLAIVIAVGIGYWVDARFDTSPRGLLIGAVIGFAAFVLRLVRMGKLVRNQVDTGAPSESNRISATPGAKPSAVAGPPEKDSQETR